MHHEEDKEARAFIGVSVSREQKESMYLAAQRVGLPLSVWLKQLGLIAAGEVNSTELRAQLDRIEGKVST